MNNKERWEEKYNLAHIYYNHYGNLKMPHDFKTSDGINYDKEGHALAKWLYRQIKMKDKLTKEQIELLEKIELKFVKPKNNFDYWYKLLKNYYDKYGNINISLKFKTKDGITYDSDGKYLGKWLQERRLKKDVTDKERYLLEKMGLVFEKKIERSNIDWNDFYTLAVNYYNHYKNIEVLASFKTLDGITYNEHGYNLGFWIANQRRRFDKLSKEKQELLKKLNIRIDKTHNEKVWWEHFNLLKKYYDHFGDLNMPSKFKTIDGIHYNNNGFNLKSWYINQITNKNLNKNEMIELLKLGATFRDKKESLTWDKWYQLATTYYNNYNNLKISATYKTFDGINYDEEGYRLGNWIANQRNSKYLTKEKIDKLNNIGMIWNVKKNKEDIEKLLLQYNINLVKNKSILKKSYQEVYSKLMYLIDNNINITNEKGEVNPIFFISNINLEALYNINLEYLINKYSINFKIKKK